MDSVTHMESVSVWTTAVDPAEIAKAISAGAEGVGMFRSEMIYQEEPFQSLLKRLLLGEISSTANRWIEMETSRMVDVLKAAGEKPFYFRLLDVAAHEYLDPEALVELGRMEVNPMLGRRGCRLGLARPEIYRGQVRALAQAWKACGERAPLGLVIPGVSDPEEVDSVSRLVRPILKSEGVLEKISIGVMIETPRAALLAGELAPRVESVHFGTNDLTQATYALSRDDADQVVDPYIEEGIWDSDPFHQIDEDGVGRLVEMALKEVGAIRQGLWHTWCGEQATHPSAIRWARRVGLRSVSVPALWVEAVRFRSALDALSSS
jgi:pyruvate,orthophosphate dikinase